MVQLKELNLDIMLKEANITLDFMESLVIVAEPFADDYNSALAHLKDLQGRLERLEV